jgi:hypothetical protein
MMKKTLLAIALSALSLTAFAASDTPDILAALSDDSAQQIALMTDEQLTETKGSGITGSSFSQYYYAWNFYGSKNDSRSYNFAYSASQPGGVSLGNGLYKVGYIFYTTTSKLGTNAPSNAFTPIEQWTATAFNSAAGPQYYNSSVVSFKNWIR